MSSSSDADGLDVAGLAAHVAAFGLSVPTLTLHVSSAGATPSPDLLRSTPLTLASAVRHRAFKGMVGTKGAAADCWHDWSVPGATLVEALAHYVGMPEFEPISGSKISKEWCHTSCEKLRDFLRLEDFSHRTVGLAWGL
eukprot:jgi/Tetstr1/459126/TSEL_004574.t1